MAKSVFTRTYTDFRRRLVRARKRAGLTQVQLARRLSRPQSFVSKIERGERRVDLIEFHELAQAIGFDPVTFLKDLYK